MKKNINIFCAITALLVAMAGCGVKPTAPVHSNPADPLNPDFQEPGVVLTAGPSEGSTLIVNSATFRWKGTGLATRFSYSLDDTTVWSAWAADTSKAYTSLTEGPHTFRIRAADAGDYQGDTIRARNFTINAINNTVLMYPAAQSVAVGETAEVWCELEDMATPVSGVRLLIYVSSNSYVDTIGALADTGYYWRRNGGTPVGPFFGNYGANYLDVSLGVAGGTPAGVSGTGRIFKIKARGMAAGSMYMYIYSIEARDTLNNPVTTTNPYKSISIYVTAKKEGAK
jgi:predicted small lipoprotein YifL